MLQISRAQRGHRPDDLQTTQVRRVAHGRAPIPAHDWHMKQLRLGFDDAHRGFAIVSPNGAVQRSRLRICLDSLLQLRPVRKSVLTRDDELCVGETELLVDNL
jgi:hypothetical protein